MIPSKLNAELFEQQDNTYVLMFYADANAVADKGFKPGSYSEALTLGKCQLPRRLLLDAGGENAARRHQNVTALRARADGEVGNDSRQ